MPEIHQPGDRNIRTDDARRWLVREFAEPVDWRMSQKGNPYARRGEATFVVSVFATHVGDRARVAFTVAGIERWHQGHVFFPEKIQREYSDLEVAKQAVETLDVYEIANAVRLARGEGRSEPPRVERTPVSKPDPPAEPGERKIRL
jgi:hypothetical protein